MSYPSRQGVTSYQPFDVVLAVPKQSLRPKRELQLRGFQLGLVQVCLDEGTFQSISEPGGGTEKRTNEAQDACGYPTSEAHQVHTNRLDESIAKHRLTHSGERNVLVYDASLQVTWICLSGRERSSAAITARCRSETSCDDFIGTACSAQSPAESERSRGQGCKSVLFP